MLTVIGFLVLSGMWSFGLYCGKRMFGTDAGQRAVNRDWGWSEAEHAELQRKSAEVLNRLEERGELLKQWRNKATGEAEWR
jgi:hypothetical protein